MIGAGVHRRSGWKTLDADPKRGGDFLARIPPLPEAVKKIQWDEIEWIHGITSLYPWDAEQVLLEVIQVLVPDGKLVLEQPNYERARFQVEHVFGDPTLRNPLIMNRWAYTPESLTALLLQTGFSRVDVMTAEHHCPARDFRIEAYR